MDTSLTNGPKLPSADSSRPATMLYHSPASFATVWFTVNKQLRCADGRTAQPRPTVATRRAPAVAGARAPADVNVRRENQSNPSISVDRATVVSGTHAYIIIRQLHRCWVLRPIKWSCFAVWKTSATVHPTGRSTTSNWTCLTG